MNTAFLQFGVFGDCLLASAVAGVVRRTMPPCRLTWIVFDQYAAVAHACPHVDAVIEWPLVPGRTRISQERERWAEMKAYAAEHFDRVIVPQLFPDHRWEDMPDVHLMDQMATYATGEQWPRSYTGSTVTPIGFRPDPASWLAGRRIVDGSREALPNVVAVNTFGVTQRRPWIPEHYTELERRLRDVGVVTLRGEADDGGMMYPLATWQSVIAHSDCYIGLDSGGTWLAASTATPQIVIYHPDPTMPRWLTGLRAARVKQDQLCHELTAPSVDQVEAKVLEIVRGKEGMA